MEDFNEVRLVCHNLINRLVSSWYLVKHSLVLSAFDPSSLLFEILESESTLSLATRHCAAGTVTARAKRIWVAKSPYDVRASTHGTRDNTKISFSCSDSTLSCDEDIFSIVSFPRYVVVVAVNLDVSVDLTVLAVYSVAE